MPAPLPGIERWPCPKGSYGGLGVHRRGRWLMFGDVRQATGFLDLESWPPNLAVHRSEYAVSFDLLPDGRVVVCSMPTNPQGDYAIRIHPPDWPTDPAAGPAEVYPLPGGLRLAEVWAVAGRVVAFDRLVARGNPPATHRAYLLDGGKFVAAPGLPPVGAFSRDHFGHQIHANGKATLATGEDVLVWDGNGYEWDGKRFELRWELDAKGRGGTAGWTSVPWGPDGFFYLSDWKILYARRGQRPVRVLPDATSVASLSPGPDDSVIACMSRDPKRHAARVWFPADGSYLPLFRAHLGFRPSAQPGPLHWVAKTGRIHFSPFFTFPDSDLRGLKPVRPRGKGYQVPKA